MTVWKDSDEFKRIDTFIFAGKRFETADEATAYALEQIREILPKAKLVTESAALEATSGKMFRHLTSISVEYDIEYKPTLDGFPGKRTKRIEAHTIIYMMEPKAINPSQAARLAELILNRSITDDYVMREIAVYKSQKHLGIVAEGLIAREYDGLFDIEPDWFWLWVSGLKRQDDTKLLTTEEAAQYLGCAVITIKRGTAAKELFPFQRPTPHLMLFRRVDLDSWWWKKNHRPGRQPKARFQAIE